MRTCGRPGQRLPSTARTRMRTTRTCGAPPPGAVARHPPPRLACPAAAAASPAPPVWADSPAVKPACPKTAVTVGAHPAARAAPPSRGATRRRIDQMSTTQPAATLVPFTLPVRGSRHCRYNRHARRSRSAAAAAPLCQPVPGFLLASVVALAPLLSRVLASAEDLSVVVHCQALVRFLPLRRRWLLPRGHMAPALQRNRIAACHLASTLRQQRARLRPHRRRCLGLTP